MNSGKLIFLSATFGVAVTGCGDQQADGGAIDPPGAVAEASVLDSAPSRLEDTTSIISDDPLLGPALDDPAAYFGVYASPDRPDRKWFIAEAKRPAYAERAPEVPPGHLMLGAMFGDVAPWQLKTRSSTEFVQATLGPGQSEAIAIEFRLDSNGKAVGFRFTGGAFTAETWLERTGDLPDGW